MTHPAAAKLYTHQLFPGEIISHAVCLYCRFPLSYHDVEELLLVRGVIVSYEAIRQWRRKFGRQYANLLRPRHLRPGDQHSLNMTFFFLQLAHFLL
jgi:putative transposase